MAITRINGKEYGMDADKKKKYLGQMKVSYEMIPSLLNLDRRLHFVDTYTDPARQIVGFIFESEEEVSSGSSGRTFEVGEAQEIPCFVPTNDELIDVMREVVRRYDENKGK
jgi:hypothetical protein